MTWDELNQAVAAFLDDPVAGLQIPTFVALGEARINRLLRHRLMLTSATLAAASIATALPADFLEAEVVALDDGRQLSATSPQGLAQALAAAGGLGGGGAPRLYTILGSSLQLWPAPAAATNVQLSYYAAVPPANPNGNWLLSAHPDLYLSACLYAACLFTRDREGAAEMDALLQRQIQELDTAREGLGARLAPHPTTVI